MKWIIFAVFAIMFLAVASIAMAENSDRNSDGAVPRLTTSTSSATSITSVIDAMNVRYQNLVCKADYTVGQIVLIEDMALTVDSALVEELGQDREKLETHMIELKEFVDDKNVSGFNAYVITPIQKDFILANEDLAAFKKNYKSYVAEGDREKFKESLRALIDEYKACSNSKVVDMSKIMKNYYDSRDKVWDQVIRSMNQRNLTTEEMEDIKDQLESLVDDLQDAIDSGNQTLMMETLVNIRDGHMHLWARFHSGRLNSYLNRIEPMANKYGRSDDVDKIKGQLDDIKPYIAPGYKYKQEDARMVWGRLHDSGDEIRDISKDMLKQRIRDRLSDDNDTDDIDDSDNDTDDDTDDD